MKIVLCIMVYRSQFRNTLPYYNVPLKQSSAYWLFLIKFSGMSNIIIIVACIIISFDEILQVYLIFYICNDDCFKLWCISFMELSGIILYIKAWEVEFELAILWFKQSHFLSEPHHAWILLGFFVNSLACCLI